MKFIRGEQVIVNRKRNVLYGQTATVVVCRKYSSTIVFNNSGLKVALLNRHLDKEQ